MKAIVVHDASGRIKSVAFVAPDLGYEAQAGEQIVEIDSKTIDPKVDPSGLKGERLHEYAKKVVENFRVANGKISKR